jgi:hypothetical protein
MKNQGLKIISLGMGVQSTCLYYMSSMGEMERADFAIFVDTGREKKKTLEYLDYLLQWQKDNNGIEILIIRKKDLFKDIMKLNDSAGHRWASIPAFTKNEDGSIGMLRRQCTTEYKIEQIDREIRILYGLAPRKRTPITMVYKGISLDEIDRMSVPREAWKVSVFPFIGYRVSKKSTEKIEGKRMTRQDIIAWYERNGLPIPPKSACVFCPYQSDASYFEMKMNEPEDFAAAVAVDEAIRRPRSQKINNPVFLHRSGVPLADIQFSAGSPDLWAGECSGVCHT